MNKKMQSRSGIPQNFYDLTPCFYLHIDSNLGPYCECDKKNHTCSPGKSYCLGTVGEQNDALNKKWEWIMQILPEFFPSNRESES